MFTGPVEPVEVFFYWPVAVSGNFYWVQRFTVNVEPSMLSNTLIFCYRRCSAEIGNLQQEQASVQRASQNLNEQIKTNKMEERKTDTQLMKIREAISKCNYVGYVKLSFFMKFTFIVHLLIIYLTNQ